jgi:hypothetical protein
MCSVVRIWVGGLGKGADINTFRWLLIQAEFRMVAVSACFARRPVVALDLALAAGIAGPLPTSLPLSSQDLIDIRMGHGLRMCVR